MKRYPLTPKQQQFFQKQAQAATNLQMAMRGALQMLVEEQGIAGRVSLSEDFSEMIEEDPNANVMQQQIPLGQGMIGAPPQMLNGKETEDGMATAG